MGRPLQRMAIIAAVSGAMVHGAGAARAQGMALPGEEEEPEDTSSPAQVVVDVTGEIGLSDGASGDPIGIAPDLWYRPASFEIGLVHSSRATTGFHGVNPAPSLCVTGDACDAFEPAVYHNVALEARVPIKQGFNSAIGINGGPAVVNFDPFGLAVKIGLQGRYVTDGGIVFGFEPNTLLAVTNRDEVEDRLHLPLTVGIAVSPRFALGLEGGLAAPFDGFGDNLQVPVSAVVLAKINLQLSALVAFTLPAAFAGDAVMVEGFDARVLSIGVSYSALVGGG